MRIAVEGCSHGELDAIYASILRTERETGLSTDLVLLCGDFQAIRNPADLQCLAVPEKYRALGQFHKYYSGAVVAPILTLVIGGNHEASNYMWELFHGGWIAPNIYYLGAAGCVDVGGLLIAGASGIWKKYDYNLGRFERMPYDKSDIRSCYHTRAYDILRLKLLATPSTRPDIVLSHDWPNTIEQAGDAKWLKRAKPFFTEEINTNTLGSPALLDLLQTLQSPYWFAAHLHVRFAALWRHGLAKQLGAVRKGAEQDEAGPVTEAVPESKMKNPEALEMDDMDFDEPLAANPEVMDIDDPDLDEEPKGSCSDEHAVARNEVPAAAPTAEATTSTARETRFLALSKALPNQDFLQLLDIPAPSDEERDSSQQATTATLEAAKDAPAASTSTDPETSNEPAALQIPTGPAADKAPASASPSLPPRYFPTLRFVPRWLAITRAMHPFLCLDKQQRPPLPPYHDASMWASVTAAEEWVAGRVAEEQASIDKILSEEAKRKEAANTDGDDGAMQIPIHLRREPHPLDIGRVQGFVRTAPAPSEPGGQDIGPPPWYTNPQTVALCAFLDVPNRINPAPPVQTAPPPAMISPEEARRRREEAEVEEIKRSAEARKAARAQQLQQQAQAGAAETAA